MEQMFDQTKDAAILATIGLMELTVSGHKLRARQWIELADDNAESNKESLLFLKLHLSEYFDDLDARNIVEDILARNDLPSQVTLSALIRKTHFLFEDKNFDEAEKISDFVLSIQNQPDANLVKWVACMRKGDKQQAQKHFQRAQKMLPEAVFNMLVAQGWVFIGEENQAMEWLYQAAKKGYRLGNSNSQLAQLANSDRYLNFVRDRE